MPTQVVNFPESTSQSQSKVVTIPNLTSIKSVTVDTGKVTYTISGNNVTLNVSNGNYTRYTTSTYTPTKDATGAWETSPGGTASQLPSTYAYDDGTYTGTLYPTGAAYVKSGSASYTDSHKATTTATCTYTDHYTWDGSSWYLSGDATYSPSSVSFTDANGYSGSLPIQSYSGSLPNFPAKPEAGTPAGTTTTRSATGTGTYSGNVSKTFPDTRVWRMDYSGTVSAPTQTTYTYYYVYNVTIDYIDKVKVGTYRIQINSMALDLPIYDPTVGMDSKNQLRITDKNGNVACFELVATNDPNASPIRTQTSSGLKAISK